MTEATNHRPFWADEKPWQKAQLPPVPGSTSVENLTSAVPTFTTVETPILIGQYTHKDGLLLYHFYHRRRKEIFDAAEAEMNSLRDKHTPEQARALQSGVAAKANVEMAESPWWPFFETVLRKTFEDQFKYQPFKVNFYPEVDGWSVAMPESSLSPMAMKAEYLEKPIRQVSEELLKSVG